MKHYYPTLFQLSIEFDSADELEKGELDNCDLEKVLSGVLQGAAEIQVSLELSDKGLVLSEVACVHSNNVAFANAPSAAAGSKPSNQITVSLSHGLISLFRSRYG